MLEVVPAGADAEIEPTARHLIEGGRVLGDDGRVTERDRCDEDAEPHRVGVPGQTAHGGEGVGRLRCGLGAPGEMIGTGEGVEALGFGEARRPQQLVVGATHLGLGHDGKEHG